jgi:hypothetical protein
MPLVDAEGEEGAAVAPLAYPPGHELPVAQQTSANSRLLPCFTYPPAIDASSVEMTAGGQGKTLANITLSLRDYSQQLRVPHDGGFGADIQRPTLGT